MKTKLFLASIAISFMGYGQTMKKSEKIPFSLKLQDSNAESASNTFGQSFSFNSSAKTNALWDIQFNYNANTATQSAGGCAGVVHIGTEFWVSKWQSDTLIRIDNAGNFIEKFTISGVTGVRGMTWDGNYIYASRNTNSIAEIDPATKTLVSSITVPSSAGTVRHISYVASADNGLGGFFVGNFGTDISLISKDGSTVLQNILASDHGLTGMYGSAYDTISTGGPYLWIFNQGSSTHDLIRLDANSGSPTGVVKNVLSDIGATSTGGLAGGMFIATDAFTGANTIGGILQGTPNRLFGYELGDYVLPAFEAEMVSYKSASEYNIRPLFMNPTITFDAKVTNGGSTVFDSLYVDSQLYDEFGTEIDNGTDNTTGLAFGDTVSVSCGFNYTPTAEGFYTSASQLRLWNGIQDNTVFNDSSRVSIAISDTILSRTSLDYTSSLGIGDGTGGFLANKYNLPVKSRVTSVTFRLNAPTAGDSVFAQINNYTSQPGNTIRVKTPTYIITEDDTNGVWITLPLKGGPKELAAGNHALMLREYSANATLATTTADWTPSTSWVKIGTGAWGTIESFDFKRAYVLFLNVAPAFAVGTDSDNFISVVRSSVYPNPANNTLNINAKAESKVSIYNSVGTLVLEKEISTGTSTLDISNLSTGVYTCKIANKTELTTEKLIISK